MSIEVYKSYVSHIKTGDAYAVQMFNLATEFSNSANVSIIDSYTPTAGRYKGDPIPSTWSSSSDVDNNGSWFIIEMDTSYSVQHAALDKWQCKIECYMSSGFSDCSGVDYGYDGTSGIICWRFSPYGGWNLIDVNPDFSPSNGQNSSNNIRFLTTAGGSSTGYIAYGDGGLYCIVRNFTDAIYSAFFTFAGYMGDINPIKTTAPAVPRCVLHCPSTQMYLYLGISTSTIRSEDGGISSYGRVDYEDNNGIWTIGKNITIPSGTTLVNEYTQLNTYPTSCKLETVPYYIIADQFGIIGDIPMMRRGYGLGPNLIDDKTWLSTSSIEGVFFQWDGSSNI